MVETKQPQGLTIITVFNGISILIVAVRLFSRYLIRRFRWDDILIILALIISVAEAVVGWGYIKTNWQGYHSYNIPEQTPEAHNTASKWDHVHQILYNPILVLVRASIIVFLLSLEQARRKIRMQLKAIWIVNWAHFFAVLFPVIFQCSPFHYTYDFEQMDRAAQDAAGAGPDGKVNGEVVRGGECIHRPAFYISTGVVSILIDAWLLCMPSAMVWGINMPKRQKFVVVVVLSVWVCATILGIVRLIVLAPLWLTRLYLNELRDDNYSVSYTLNQIEPNISIWTACAPAFKALITRFFPRFWVNPPYLDPAKPSGQRTPNLDVEETVQPPTIGDDQELEPAQPNGEASQPRPSKPPYLGAGQRAFTQSELDLHQFEREMDSTALGRVKGVSERGSRSRSLERLDRVKSHTL